MTRDGTRLPVSRAGYGVVAECERRGVVFLAYSPVGGGRLSKRLPKLAVVAEIARAHEASPYAVVLAWVRSKGERSRSL
ncbi:MAG TPA: hypothetical protein VMS98_00525 [Thermoanaerobaculia bacterium]|nr:hypothetical protein [Thermoanaerobaculia bacterium]